MQSAGRDVDVGKALQELRRLGQGVHSSSEAGERSLGVSGAQLFVLHELAAEPRLSIRRLSERTLTDPSSVSIVIQRLVERGWVVRARSTEDARRTELALTTKGKRLIARAPVPYQARLIGALRAVPSARLRLFRTVLSEVADALQVARGPSPLFFEAAAPSRRGKR